MSSDVSSDRSEKWAKVRKRPRKNGTICYSVTHWIDGKQTSFPFDDEQAAGAFEALVKVHGATQARAMYDIPPPTPRGALGSKAITVAEYLRHYIDHLTGVEQYTVDKYEEYLRNDIAPILGDLALVKLREEDIARWVKHMEATPTRRKKPPSPKTIKNKHGFLSGALRAAVDRGLITSNPAAGRRLPRRTGNEDGDADDDAEIRMLTRKEFGSLKDATTEYWQVFQEFLVASGARWGEVAALKPTDVNRETGAVKVRRAWKKSSKGYHIGPVKTKRSKRTINLPLDLIGRLDYSHEWLFVNRDGGPVRYSSFRRNVWDKAVARAGLNPPPTPHALRHTCGSWMLAKGIPITTVSRHLGHEDIQTTVNIYGDVDRSSFESAAAVMGELLSDDNA